MSFILSSVLCKQYFIQINKHEIIKGECKIEGDQKTSENTFTNSFLFQSM